MDDGGSAHSSPLGNLTAEEVTSKIILTAIIVLFMAVLFVLLLHLYAKLYWWRVDQQQQEQLQQQQQQQQQQEQPSDAAPTLPMRRHRRRFIFVPGQDTLRNAGLSPSALSSLPIVVFRQENYKDGLECAVCLSELVNGDKARLLPKCNHSFHVDCIDMWFQSQSTCPICRNTVLGPEQANLKRIEPVSDNVADSNINNHDPQSQNSNLAVSSPESPNFPTNVLVWGNQNQVSTGNNNVASFEDGPVNATSRSQESVVVEINDAPANANTGQNVLPSSSTSMRFLVEEEEQPKSPMTTRLRSLKRFLSRDKRVACSNGGGGSSSTSATSADA